MTRCEGMLWPQTAAGAMGLCVNARALGDVTRLGVTSWAPQVLQVVREQVTRTLSLKPTSLELFKTRVNALNYSEILKLRQTERLHQEETLAVPVL